MSRFGLAVLGLIVVAAGLFGSMLTFGGPRTGARWHAVSTMPVPEAAAGDLAVPVRGVARSALRDSWNEARDGGARGHHGTDIMAPGGTPVVATAAGTIEKLFTSERGGTTLYQRSADGRWMFYYAHLARYADDIREGERVAAGRVIGYVGDTGDAGPGNTHLHFGLTRMAPGEHWWQGQDVDPYPLLAGTGRRR
jgi:murein DD-endopeptidase MepM/ murein hydrolase activator NlpD